MVSGVRGIVFSFAALLLVGALSVQSAEAADGAYAAPESQIMQADFSKSIPAPAESIDLALEPADAATLTLAAGATEEISEPSILPVPVPPALLCLLTAFAGLALLGRRRESAT